MKVSTVHAVPQAGYANTWLVEEEGNLMAVDVGTCRAADHLYRYVTDELNMSPERIKVITATHFHYDHIGGIEKLLRLCPGARVYFSSRVRKIIRGEEQLAMPSPGRWIFGLAAIALRMPRIARGTLYSFLSPSWGTPTPLLRGRNNVSYAARCDFGGAGFITGYPGWRVMETPGHTPDSICFYNKEKRILLAGDTILNMRGRGELNSFCSDPRDIRRSFERLREFPVDSIYPGHGVPIIGVPHALDRVSCRGV